MIVSNAPSGPAAQQEAYMPPLPLDGFSTEEFRSRRKALRETYPDGILLVRGSTEREFTGPLPYRQNSAFYYLTGVQTPGAFLVMLPEGVPPHVGNTGLSKQVREILFLPARNPSWELWTGPKLGPGEETQRLTGIEATLEAGRIWGLLTTWLSYCATLYVVAPYGEEARFSPDYALIERIRQMAPTAQFRDLGPGLAKLRMIKSPAEIERIEQAIAVTDEALRAARNLIHEGDGRYEYEVEAEVLHTFRRHGAVLGFAPIIGSGINATILHYTDNRKRMENGETVVVDIGAQVGAYTADLTRTFIVGGRPSARQREIYTAVAATLKHLVNSYQPGVDSLDDLNRRCKAFLKAHPLRVRNAGGEEQTLDTFMPHGAGHHLGLDVHDVGERYEPLQPGAVFTIEPGLYLPEERIGVRLENDYLVTESGLRELGNALSVDVELE
ncbi:MAG TPA: Xaa-Pro peptidase family protein [Chthonomonas sp.]|uniref:Xaa-Pro peptidase family protein n=1 Tax=Chthonomonas sp. TaxID=2282153 RepID=UPI002B4B412D|nr:Xaa-Pro peptidase family protein [Chthonomonas sp.]HLH79355.1 Xaa-Pro peptidase family protein [Chthonomonas sp.]